MLIFFGVLMSHSLFWRLFFFSCQLTQTKSFCLGDLRSFLDFVQRTFCALQVDNCAQVMWHESKPCDQWRSGREKKKPHLLYMKHRVDGALGSWCALLAAWRVGFYRLEMSPGIVIRLNRLLRFQFFPTRWGGSDATRAWGGNLLDVPRRASITCEQPEQPECVSSINFKTLFRFLWGRVTTWSHCTWSRWVFNAWAVMGLSFFSLLPLWCEQV